MTALGTINSTSEVSSGRQVPVVQYTTPATGDTISVGTTGFIRLLINPAGSLLALTVSLPSTPTDGDILQMSSSQIVTGLTMSNGTIIGALTTLAVATFAQYTYSGTASKWFRSG